MRYSKSWTKALQEVQEQVGVRKVDFADGVTPDIEPEIEEAKIPEGLSKEGAAEFMAAASAAKKAGKKTFKFGDKEYPVTIKVDIPTSKKEETDLEEAKGEFEVKYASSKKGPIKVSTFNTLEDAKKFLAQVKKEGMNGIISKGGKPVKEEKIECPKCKGEGCEHCDGKGYHMKEAVEESAALQMKMAADDIETYAKKHGGIDKKDMMKAASMLKKGDKAGALKFIKTLDTDPRDYLLKTMGEEVEIDEKKSDYEDQIKAYLAKGGKIQKGDKPNQKKIDKVTKGFMKKLGIMKKKEAELDAKDKEELEKMMGEASDDVKKRLGMFKRIRDKKASQGFQKTGLKNVESVEEHCGECGAMDHVDEKMDGRKKFSGKQAKKDNEDRRAAQRKKLGILGPNEETIDEKSDYELYHKTFSAAMQHAYAHAKKKGYTVDPDEIDNKVATGPKKPSAGKTNRYILGTDKKQKVHIQVANLDNKRYELNMYIEEVTFEGTDTDEAINAINEAISLAQRKAKGRQMRILSKKASTQKKKELNKKKSMPLDVALKKGQKQARKMVMQKVVGKGKDLAGMSPQEKEKVEVKTDKRIKSMGAKYKTLAKKFAKQIIKKHNQAKASAGKKE